MTEKKKTDRYTDIWFENQLLKFGYGMHAKGKHCKRIVNLDIKLLESNGTFKM
jgi:hypothetical protein